MKILLLAAFLLGCTSDHVVGSVTDAAASGGAGGGGGMGGSGGSGGMPDARPVDAMIDAPTCGGNNQPCCPTGRPCQGGLSCQNGTCQN
jgi:hypothetical protein